MPYDEWRRQALAGHTKDAEALCEVLVTSLPGGTFDALLRAMLLRRASLFRVTL